MTLEEAIEHCHEKAAELDVKAMCIEEAYQTTEQAECERCAEEHRRLAEWLMELNQLRNESKNVKSLLREVKILLHHALFVNWKDRKQADELYDKIKSVVGGVE